ncbi:MAG: hypothetical protein RMJ37_07285 [Spirochaetia bacterium]|nr:hypothetical protein [Spirochaetota bacterium]MCX8097391.1 hypothetical protein [Spirochaetota bacterium]MDW8113116.1 hypothetical protein [Spirochaetia bacterium]
MEKVLNKLNLFEKYKEFESKLTFGGDSEFIPMIDNYRLNTYRNIRIECYPPIGVDKITNNKFSLLRYRRDIERIKKSSVIQKINSDVKEDITLSL